MKIGLFYNNNPGTVGEYFARALAAEGLSLMHTTTAGAERCPGGADVYLRIDHGDYTYGLPPRFRPVAFYVVDTHLAKSWRNIRTEAPRYDAIFCAQRRAAARLPRATWVPLGCDEELHRAAGRADRYDLAFVGNDGGVPRKFLLQALRERYPRSFIGQAPWTEMASIYGAARIGVHYIFCTSPLKDHVSMRAYEVLAAGAMLLANEVEAGAFEAVGLEPGRHLVLYRDARELFTQIDYYLAHEAERARIAAAGQTIVLASHTYRHRARMMLPVLARLAGRA